MPRTIPSWTVVLGLFLIFGLCLAGPVRAQQAQSWLDSDDMLLLYEALTDIGQRVITPEPEADMVHKAIKGYLNQLDEFSDLLTPAEYARWQAAMSDDYAGVGMEIFEDHSGRILCVPYPGGPADKGGIAYGDVLLFVEDASVAGRSLYLVGADIRGPMDTSVRVTVQDRLGTVRSLSLVREAIDRPAVSLDRVGELDILRIYHFDADTDLHLAKALETLDPDRLLAIDLRGNTGGDFNAAVRCAALFLPEGAVIVDKRTQTEMNTFRSGPGTKSHAPLALWQDGLTASAAEVFLGALTGNQRAESVGVTSFGKGVAQAVVELSDGSVMFVTDGALRTPAGEYYHRRGLGPTHPLGSAAAYPRDAYLQKTLELARSGALPGL